MKNNIPTLIVLMTGLALIGGAAFADETKKAQSDFMGEVEKIMARDKIGKAAAMEKATREFPALAKAYQDGSANAAN